MQTQLQLMISAIQQCIREMILPLVCACFPMANGSCNLPTAGSASFPQLLHWLIISSLFIINKLLQQIFICSNGKKLTGVGAALLKRL